MAYQSFARVYDLFMDNIPYEELMAAYQKQLKKAGIESGLVCELGCGTGTMTTLFCKTGYDMIGIDRSEEMLAIAQQKKSPSSDILYLCQDIRAFELYGTVRAVVSSCDTLNYITEPAELYKVFSLVNNYLDPEGLFVFDLKTPWLFSHRLGNKTITDNREEACLIWENENLPAKKLHRYYLTMFLPPETENEEETFHRSFELHEQRIYTLPEITELLQKAGLVFLCALDAETGKAPTPQTARWLIVAKEHGKTQPA